MSRRTLSFALLLCALTWAVGCAGGPPPEKQRPEITLERIREDINGEWVRVPAEDGASKPSAWRFQHSEPKEIEILEKQVEGDQATIVIHMRTSTSRRAEEQGYTKKLAGRLRLHYELQRGWALRKWEIVKIDNLSFVYLKE
jgi:hypothetical protein